MLVSVILTVLNEGTGMGELLDALLAQSSPPDEIVVVDGGSRDNTRQILDRYAARDARIKVHTEPGVNIARGRNLAILKAQGDIIAVTDGGCRPDRDWLRELVRPFREDSAVGAVGGKFIPVTQGRFEHYCGRLSVPDFASESQRGMFYGRSSAFRRALWQEAGGYPEWLYTAEDTLFALRAQRLGRYKIVHAENSLLYWRPRPTLPKMAKMFYLYGRGNGRIQHGTIRGSLYWLKYFLALIVTLALGVFFPWLWVVSALVGWHLYRTIAKPNLVRMDSAGDKSWDRYLYVPLITLTRNLSTNLGFAMGWLEFKRGGDFKQKLDEYMTRCGA